MANNGYFLGSTLQYYHCEHKMPVIIVAAQVAVKNCSAACVKACPSQFDS